MKKIKLFTHTDLDGIGCAILAKEKFGKANIDISYCNYDDINQKVEEFYIGSGKFNYVEVYITDISVNEEVANIIESYQDCVGIPSIQLIDHHQTALWLNKYDWGKVDVENKLGLTSGTSLFAELLYCDFTREISSRKTFIELVRRYDTWEWFNKYDDKDAKQLNDLLYILGRDRFVEDILSIIEHSLFFNLSEGHKLLLEIEQEKICRYIDSKNKNLIEKDILGHKAGIVFGEQFHSELGNALSILNPHLDFIVIINMDSSVSYRTTKDGINLGLDVAKAYGGGGHPKSSGSPIGKNFKSMVVQELFKEDIN